jgi:DNA-directed RNA polymerase specialized sigma24 family protein
MITQRADKLSDEQLMARLDGPEVEVAISALYDRYRRTVFGVGLKILGDRSSAEELVQEVFLKVWRSSGTFDPSRGELFDVALQGYAQHRPEPVSQARPQS